MEEHFEITVGQNLKRIRKDLNLRQHQIAGDDITRNLISLIENDKATLYDTAANIMARNINKIMSERNLNIFIKPEDLLNPERYDARKKADTYIERLKNDLANKKFDIELDELNEIEAFLNEWDLTDKKVKIYELLGNIFYESNNLSKEYYYYFKALEASYDLPNMKKRYKIALKLVSNCIVTGKCEEAISLCKYMLISQDDLSTKSKGIFYYNIALALKKLKNFDKCLRTLNKAKLFFDKSDHKNLKSIFMLEGVCFYRLGDYNNALQSYSKIIEISDKKNNLDEICVTYINIILIYMKRNDKESVIKYLDKVMDKLPYVNEDSFYLTEIYFEISNVLLYLKRYDACEEYLNIALVLANKNSKQGSYRKYLGNLMELYIEANYTDKLSSLLKTIEDEISNIKLNEESLLVLKLLHYFIKQNRIEVAADFMESLIHNEKGV
ncbi:Xre family DNA-binding domain-/TPR repeat-containing protein [Proteiniborus sp. DW1]|nr:Xre family DNA-binding domain-/TPR repeat-containing protein [Proteiniborus sp. DW1]